MPYRDLREFIEKLWVEGELHRIKAEVDWNLELAHIAKLNEERNGPALLFEKVKGYNSPVLASAFCTVSRLALALDMPKTSTLVDLMREWVRRCSGEKIPPKWVNDGPCKENVDEGDKVNLLKFPVPKLFPLDGSRYFGTAVFTITKDPETGWINLGTYRHMLIDERTLGTNFIKGKHAEITLQKYAERKEPMPVAVVVGADPILFLLGSSRMPAFESEYNYAGALKGEPVEVVRGETVDLPIPATAEIVIEGEVDPFQTKPEGPFGEYTGYYSGAGSTPKPYVKVSCVSHRDNPVFWMTTVGRAVTDTHMIMALTYGSALWHELEAMKIPGIKGVYCPPEGAGRMIAIISIKQMYPGHAMHVGTAAISTEMGHYGLKTVIVVDDDIEPWDVSRVLWALSFRFQPSRAQIIHRGRSTPLDPSLPIESRQITSRIIIDATIPFEWKQKPIPVTLQEEVVKRINQRWGELFGEKPEIEVKTEAA